MVMMKIGPTLGSIPGSTVPPIATFAIEPPRPLNYGSYQIHRTGFFVKRPSGVLERIYWIRMSTFVESTPTSPPRTKAPSRCAGLPSLEKREVILVAVFDSPLAFGRRITRAITGIQKTFNSIQATT